MPVIQVADLHWHWHDGVDRPASGERRAARVLRQTCVLLVRWSLYTRANKLMQLCYRLLISKAGEDKVASPVLQIEQSIISLCPSIKSRIFPGIGTTAMIAPLQGNGGRRELFLLYWLCLIILLSSFNTAAIHSLIAYW